MNVILTLEQIHALLQAIEYLEENGDIPDLSDFADNLIEAADILQEAYSKG